MHIGIGFVWRKHKERGQYEGKEVFALIIIRIMGLKELGYIGIDWIELTEDRDWYYVVNTLMNLRVT
jgi:hypothetical protein